MAAVLRAFSFLFISLVLLQGPWAQSEEYNLDLNSAAPTRPALFRAGMEISKEGALLFEVAPMAFFDFYKDEYITRQNVGSSLDALELIPTATSEEGLYDVVKRFKVEAGIGAALMSTVVDTPVLNIIRPFIGLLPLGGVEAISERQANTLAEARALAPLFIPLSADTLESKWRVGDTLTYSVQGGAYFVAGVSAFFLSTGAHYLVKGEFETTIHKLTRDLVEVTISKTNMKSVGVMSSMVLTGVDSSRFKEETLRFSFLYDLRNPTARLALQNFLGGEIRSSQILARDGEGAGVFPASRESLRTTGRMRHLRLGIPFFYWTNWGKAHVRTLRFKEEYLAGAEIDVEIGMFVKTKEKRHLMTKIAQTTAFYGTQGIELTGMGQIIRREQGVLSFNFRRSKATRRQLGNVLEDLTKMTGMVHEFDIDLGDERRLGALDLNFNLLINEELTSRLLNLVNNKNQLQQISQRHYDSYLASKGSQKAQLDYCPEQLEEYESCLQKLESEMKSATERAYEALLAMKKSVRSSRRDFVENYAKFGEAWIDSPFTFQTFLGILKGKELKATLEIETTNANKLFIGYDWR